MDPTALEAPCGLMLFDDDGVIITSNPALHRMLGYQTGTTIQGNVRDILTAAGNIFYQTYFFPTLKLEGKLEEIYLIFRGAEGRELPFIVNASRIEQDGRVLNYAALFRIDKRGRFEDELVMAKKEAERANQAKDHFLATLSHELRTPLTPVLLRTAMMETDPSLPEEVRNEFAAIRRNVELEARLIDDLLDITRISHGKLRLDQSDADAHEIVKQAQELVQHQADEKNIRISVHWEADFPVVSGDPARLQQVFWNLLQNAIKFTPAGGGVRISSQNTTPDILTLYFADSGKGIAPEMLTRLFQAFEQGTPEEQKKFGGLGLGLAISTGIISLHGGSILAESEGPGKGATFMVRLPAVRKPPAGIIHPAPAAPHARAAELLRILLVEDHESSRETLTILLRRAGHRVTSFANGEEALEFARHTNIDLLISDLGLPGISGLDLMRKLQETHPVRGIALSGYGSDEDLLGTSQAGFSAHLVKPVNFTELKTVISRVAGSRQEKPELVTAGSRG